MELKHKNRLFCSSAGSAVIRNIQDDVCTLLPGGCDQVGHQSSSVVRCMSERCRHWRRRPTVGCCV